MSLIVTILGCGSSGGVPRPALGWGDCDPNEPKNRRRRCSILLERRSAFGVTRVLVDTSPDLREQLLAAEVDALDGVLYTHEHADHTHGVDDLRPLFIKKRGMIDVYLDAATRSMMEARFGYCFASPPGSSYPPILRAHDIAPGREVAIAGSGGPIAALPFAVDHGDIAALGFRFGDLAYTPDVKRIPPESVAALRGLDLWIIDALRYTPHPTHFNVAEALDWVARMRPRRAVLTNMHSDIDYARIKAEVPGHIDIAYDGMRVEALGTRTP